MAGILPRSLIGTPSPPPSRRRLMRVGVLLAHEVGVATNPTSGRYQSSMPAHVLGDARAAASFGVSAGKSWEYSYMLGRDGSIFEQAGEFMASHCLNFNTESLGVIWLNALGVPPTLAQIEAWWWLRSHLVDTGQLTELHTVAPHYRYRATSCCGVLAETPGAAWKSPTGEGRLGNLIPALTAEPGPVPALPQEDDDMAIRLISQTKGEWIWSPGTCPQPFKSAADRDAITAAGKYAGASVTDEQLVALFSGERPS